MTRQNETGLEFCSREGAQVEDVRFSIFLGDFVGYELTVKLLSDMLVTVIGPLTSESLCPTAGGGASAVPPGTPAPAPISRR